MDPKILNHRPHSTKLMNKSHHWNTVATSGQNLNWESLKTPTSIDPPSIHSTDPPNLFCNFNVSTALTCSIYPINTLRCRTWKCRMASIEDDIVVSCIRTVVVKTCSTAATLVKFTGERLLDLLGLVFNLAAICTIVRAYPTIHLIWRYRDD